MARVHGKDTRVYYGSRDISDDLAGLTIEATVDAPESTTLGNDWKRHDAGGLAGWTASLDAFYQPDSGGIGRQFEDLFGADGILSMYDGDADAIGDAGVLCSAGVLKQRGQPINVNELIKLSGEIQGNGRVGLHGRLLHPLGAETVSFNGSSHDNAASSANGGRGTIHVTSCTGTWTIKVQHSTNDSLWVDLITFTAATAATSQTVEVTGTVNRYLRIIGTEDVAGTVTFVGGFARY